MKNIKLLQGAILLVSFVLSLSVLPAFGQGGASASLYGSVTDSTQAAIAGTKVTVTNLGTNVSWTAVSDASGNYIIPDLPIGQYKVVAERTGFAAFEVTGVSVVVAQNTRVNVAMQLGTAMQTITVTAGAPLVDTESAAAKGTVERQFIDQLPLINRDVTVLEVLQAGTSNGGAFGLLSVNGARGGHNESELDGLTINNPQYAQVRPGGQTTFADYPSPDALQEFTLVRSAGEAQYGRADGGQVIVATRSGTNQYHGSAFDYLRNNVLDARSFFAGNKTPYHRNIFGATLGGPIQKNKLFFFSSYEGTRTRSNPNAGVQNVVPSQAQRNGDFSALATPIIDPMTGQPFSNNMIPGPRRNTLTQSLLTALVPLPNGPNNSVIFAPASIVNSDQGIAKIDVMLSSKDHVSGTLFIARTSTLSENALPTLFTQLATPYTTIIVNETHSFSPTLLNDFTIGGTHDGFTQSSAGVAGQDTWGTFGSTYFIPAVNHTILATVNGNLNVGEGSPSIRPGQLIQLQDSLHWIRGNHTLVFGFSGTQGRTWTTTGNRASGFFGFNGFATGNPVADFILGIPSAFNQNQTAYIPHLGQDYALYAQDGWRIKRNVTVNFGVRYAPSFYESNRMGQNATFIPGEQSTVFPTAPRSLVYKGDANIDGNYYHRPTFDVFEPRFGVAWTPLGHSSWVVRSGFGMFHQELMDFSVSNNLLWPNTYAASVPTPPSMVNPYQGQADPFPFTPVSTSAPLAQRQALTPPASISGGDYWPLDAKIPVSLGWNFTVQHQIGSHDSIEAAYVGSHAYRVESQIDGNPPFYIPGLCGGAACSTEGNVNSRRTWPGINLVYMNYSNGLSNYNAFQLTYRHEVAKGLTVMANYTNSRTMTCATGDADQNDNFWNPFNFRANYGIAGYDIAQVANIAYAWSSPYFASGHGPANYLLRGWTLSGYLNAQGGVPLTVYTGGDNSLSGYDGDHANQIGRWQLSGGRSRGQQIQEWFNTTAFTVNAVGTYGSVGNHTIRGPGGRYWDMSFFRDFPIGERIKLQFRFDGENIFNHPVLGNSPNATLSSAGFGTDLSTQSNPRLLQMALRLIF